MIDFTKNHIKTHSKKSEEDVSAVSALNYFLLSNGKINTNFLSNDKWPNHDGTFEFISNPSVSRSPEQVFFVQIKGTKNNPESDGCIKYRLNSLAFPEFIAREVTADPGILFVIFNTSEKGAERIFWKYLSPSVINNINFKNGSTTIEFYPHEEIKNTNESIEKFCEELQKIIETHLFLNKLNKEKIEKQEVDEIIKIRCEEVSKEINELAKLNETDEYLLRDKSLKIIVRNLYDICYSVLVLNALKLGFENVNERLAWDIARFDIKTKYLSDFMVGLKYIGLKIPGEGQSERLMLKYYTYLWEIKKFLKESYNLKVLSNLKEFPLEVDCLDKEYYEMVANSIEKLNLIPAAVTSTRYYIQKKVPFYVGEEKYYEITLQLASSYATKFNRITVYTKLDIFTSYSIQIACFDIDINLFGINSTIKVINNWKVSINPMCLNQIGKIIRKPCSIKSTHGEYSSLMKFLTETGMNLLELIDLETNLFNKTIEKIYHKTNTSEFKELLILLHNNYSINIKKRLNYTLRYILLQLREEIFKEVLPKKNEIKFLNDELFLSKRCYPFEKNPCVSNLVGKRTNKAIYEIDKVIADRDIIKVVRPYLLIESLTRKTGEIYVEENLISSNKEIDRYNSSLDEWEINNGYKINRIGKFVYIESYEKNLISILSKLLNLSKISNQGQRKLNENYIKKNKIKFLDKNKERALKKIFVSSGIMLIYGAAGTGKTTLMNDISNMFSNEKKLFLTKTHTALHNLKRNIDNPGPSNTFKCIDSFIKSNSVNDYSIIFVDECSTIDNRTMFEFMNKINDKTFLVLAGDTYQIESIDFGNWFCYAKEFIRTDGSNVELVSTWRTKNEKLKKLWNEVRKNDIIIIEKLVIDGPFSENIGEDIFKYNENEIILCLNYDGKFGLNNMNNYFQNLNPSKEVFSWAEWTFKKGDPIIFFDTKRSELLYNNLKGKIIDIFKDKTGIIFILDVDTKLTEEQCLSENFKFLEIIGEKTRIELKVLFNNEELLSEEESEMRIIPFQLAYAISIHKAQGLEYESVKIVIPSVNEEKITHSIFYTAITRAKNKLKIYWSAETMEKIVKSFSNEKKLDNGLVLIKNRLEQK